MNSDTPLDYALFQLSPRRSHCELFVSGDGKTEKLASGLLKPFVTHLKVAEEQVAQAVQTIKLEVERRKNPAIWFNKGTLERFVRFVSTPEVLELVNTFDAEMSQLEGARRIYSQGAEDPLSGVSGENERSTTSTADITKKELLKAIDVRLLALKQDLAMACARASAAGFTINNISELLLFADRFGAYRLNEACTKFISLCRQRPELLAHHHHPPPSQPQQPQQWKEDRDLRSSSSSDMSIEEDPDDTNTTSTSTSSKPATTISQRTTQQAACEQRLVESEKNKGGSGWENGDPLLGLTQPPPPPAGGTRRLSVQERINLFENKQKEQLGGANTGGSGGSKVGGKVELRRLSSDVSSSVEKSVLRRWSGASDMSIDVNSSNSFSGRKEVESASTTPSSSLNSQTHTASRNEKDTAASRPRSGLEERPPLSSSSSFSSLLQAQAQSGSFSKDRDRTEAAWLKDQAASLTQLKSLSGRDLIDSTRSSRVESVELGGQVAFQNLSKASLDVEEYVELNNDQFAARTPLRGVSSDQGRTGEKLAPEEREISKVPQIGILPNKPNRFGSIEAEIAVSSVRTVSGNASVTQFRTLESRREDTRSNEKAPSKSQSQLKAFQSKVEDTEAKSSQLSSEFRRKSFPGKSETSKGELDTPQVQSGSSLSKVQQEEHSQGTAFNQQEMKPHRQTSGPDQTRKSQSKSKREERKPQSIVLPVSTGRKAKISEEALDLTSTRSSEPVHITKASKGNQELNNVLQMKADELEKLFAAHKLRVPGDQAASTWRGKPTDSQADNMPKSMEKKSVEFLAEHTPVRYSMGAGMEFNTDTLMKMVGNQDYSHGSTQKLGNLSSLDDVRGKFYQRYMQKRDEKLREEWGSKRAQKEAKMKAMQDSLEHSRAELEDKFSRPADRLDSAVLSHRRADKLRSYSGHAVMKNKEQPVDFQQSEEEEDAQESFEQRDYGKDRFLSEPPLSDCSSKSFHYKKLLSRKTVSSSTPRNAAAAPVSKPSRPINSGPERHRMQPENPLAQSVPNFSDLRKENTKPPSGISKTTTCAQTRNYTHSRSISEEINFDKEDKPHRSQSMRKSSVGPIELKDSSTINLDSASLLPLKSSKEQNEHDRTKKGMESKSFLRKGNGIGPGSGASIAKLKASMVSGNPRYEEGSEDLAAQMENSPSMVNEEDEFEVVSTGELSRTDNEKARLSVESVHSGDQESENGEILGSFSQVEDDSAAELAATASRFHNSVTMHESPGESPMSWNSRIHHSFSYAQEASDIDASLDSPVGSPPSWNSHPLNQMMESDASRMRKKWGSAQKPIIVANTSHQPRKDVTKGFKRLLKFGRKSKGADYLINDWVSASTNSEGDDDAEDGRDPANRISDDVRKSRMGFPQFHSAYDGFNDSEIFQDQAQSFHSSIPGAPANFKIREDQLSGSSLKAPRSFFSLSTFRSKGSESKLR